MYSGKLGQRWENISRLVRRIGKPVSRRSAFFQFHHAVIELQELLEYFHGWVGRKWTMHMNSKTMQWNVIDLKVHRIFSHEAGIFVCLPQIHCHFIALNITVPCRTSLIKFCTWHLIPIIKHPENIISFSFEMLKSCLKQIPWIPQHFITLTSFDLRCFRFEMRTSLKFKAEGSRYDPGRLIFSANFGQTRVFLHSEEINVVRFFSENFGIGNWSTTSFEIMVSLDSLSESWQTYRELWSFV